MKKLPIEVEVALTNLNILWGLGAGIIPANTAETRRQAVLNLSPNQMRDFARNANTVLEYIWDDIAKPVE